MLAEETSRMSRGHIRFFASVERAGPWFKVFMSVFPILVNLAWVCIYFVERDNDVFREGGTCSYANRSQLFEFPSPFFITTRSLNLWQTQTLFAMLNAFLWAPFRYMRTGLTRANFAFLMVIELLTVFPFLFSLVFFPAYVAYVPTYLRGFIMKHEILFVLGKEGVKDRGNRVFLTWSLVLDLFSTMITVIGILEWAQNNFPREGYDDLYGQPDQSVFGCYSFFVCIYWFIVTISTVGYGDVVPLNSVARSIIVCSIAFCLLFLPEFINRVTMILRLRANLRQVEFAPPTHRNFVIVAGTFPLPAAQQALTLLQPKYIPNEFAVKHLVLILDEDGEDGEDGISGGNGEKEEKHFAQLTTDQGGLFCELFLMQGRVLQSEDGLLRAQARAAKSIYLLPRRGLRAHTRDSNTAEYCLRRDFDQLKRFGALRNRMGSDMVRTRTVLFHQANKHLLLLPSSSSSNSACACNPISLVCLDAFGQRMAASTVLVPGFNTLWSLLLLAGSVTDKTFSEYDAEADGERELAYSPAPAPSAQGMLRRLAPEHMADSDEVEFARCLQRNTLLLVAYSGSRARALGDLRARVLASRRVLVLGFVRQAKVCGQHFDFNAQHVVFAPIIHVQTGDYLVCFGDSYEIAQLSDADLSCWKEEVKEDGWDDVEAAGICLDLPVPLPPQPPAASAALTQHVIVHAAAHASFTYFCEKLRDSALLEKTVPILLIDTKPPNAQVWNSIAALGNVHFMLASPLIAGDLMRAGFEHARALVLLVDFRDRYQDGASRDTDEENLLAQQVAAKLKSTLSAQCQIRILTHLVKEDHFEYIAGNSTKLRGELALGEEEHVRLKRFIDMFETTVWPPIQSVSYIAGECFFPSIFLPMFFACETRGNWLQAFLEALCQVAGQSKNGLVLRPSTAFDGGSVTYAQLTQSVLARSGGALCIGLFRNYYEEGGGGRKAQFRGVLLFPSNELLVTARDAVFVLE